MSERKTNRTLGITRSSSPRMKRQRPTSRPCSPVLHPNLKATILAAAKRHGIEVGGKPAKALAILEDGFKKLLFINLPADATDEVKKGMWEVSAAAQTLQDLYWICTQSAWEREREGDESEVPDELKSQLKELGQ